jgi:hypothetical protein
LKYNTWANRTNEKIGSFSLFCIILYQICNIKMLTFELWSFIWPWDIAQTFHIALIRSTRCSRHWIRNNLRLHCLIVIISQHLVYNLWSWSNVKQRERANFFVCPICSGVVLQPVECGNCSSVFCQECILPW